MREAELRDAALLRTGIVGGVIAAVCCFTPVLVVLLGVVGLSALVGWLDYMLLPALAVFVAITVYAPWRRATGGMIWSNGSTSGSRRSTAS